jgi:hypothetical protein
MIREEELLDLSPLTTLTKKNVIRLVRDNNVPLPYPFNGTYFRLELFYELDTLGLSLIELIGPNNWLYVTPPPLLLEHEKLALYQFLSALALNGSSWCLHLSEHDRGLKGYFVQEFNSFCFQDSNFITSYHY